MPTSPELMRRLRAGKDALRQARREAPLSEKLRQLVYAQHLYVQVAGSRRQLKPWQRPWNILNQVSEFVVIGSGQIEPTTKARVITSAHAQWLRPRRQPF
jgi:hypothetical protein